MPENKLKLKGPDEVVVRMYGQGFGDCFLLAFPRAQAGGQPDPDDPVYVLIDSGVFYRTPGERKRMSEVAKNVRQATGGTIDLLVATHEHQDHLSGFEYAKDDWKQIGVRRIWLAWTEDENHPATQVYDREKEALQLQAEIALRVASLYQEQDTTLAKELERVNALLGFAGEAEDADEEGSAEPAALGVGEIRPPRKLSKTPDKVLDDFTKAPGKRFSPDGPLTEREFCEPGQVRTVPGTSVDAYVLAPPTAQGRLAQEFDAGEVYHEDDGAGHALDQAEIAQRLEGLAYSERAERESIGFALNRFLPAGEDGRGSIDLGAPFQAAISLPIVAARQHPFFREHYFGGRSERMIDTDWLHSFSRLALQVDRVINNTSLVLAFRLPDGRVLLFAADAQVGNWLSWHDIQREDWRRPEGGQVDFRPTAAELLARTIVYKVGHHGSHNATLKAKGVELMPEGLIAFVPASRVFPQEKSGWTIPLPALTDALWRKSGGQVVFPHEHPDYDYANTPFEQRVEKSDEKFDPMVQGGETIEEGVPLWRQVRI